MIKKTCYDKVNGLSVCAGPIVRINPHELHVSDPAWLDTLYTGPGPVGALTITCYSSARFLSGQRFEISTLRVLTRRALQKEVSVIGYLLIVRISTHEGYVHFCDWLTQKYLSSFRYCRSLHSSSASLSSQDI